MEVFKSFLQEVHQDLLGLSPLARMAIYVILGFGIFNFFPFWELAKLLTYVVLVPLGAYHAFKLLTTRFADEWERLRTNWSGNQEKGKDNDD